MKSNLNYIQIINNSDYSFQNNMILQIKNNYQKVIVIIIQDMLFILKDDIILFKINIISINIIINELMISFTDYDFILYSFSIKLVMNLCKILKKSAIIKSNISNEYLFIGNIGEGKTSLVYKVYDKQNNLYYACKEINTNFQSKSEFLNEIKILRKLNHINIIKTVQTYINNSKFYIITNLYLNYIHFLNLKNETNFPILCLRVIKGLVNGLFELKNNNYVHRDLSIQNILFKRINPQLTELDVVISDFGNSKKVNNKLTFLRRAGTPSFIDPLILNNNKLELNEELRKIIFSVDIFSLGSILYFFLTRKFLIIKKNFSKNIETELRKSLKNYKWDDLLTNEIITLVKSMLKRNIYKRIKVEELLYHRIFNIIYN